jgi:hypothetical protein
MRGQKTNPLMVKQIIENYEITQNKSETARNLKISLNVVMKTLKNIEIEEMQISDVNEVKKLNEIIIIKDEEIKFLKDVIRALTNKK